MFTPSSLIPKGRHLLAALMLLLPLCSAQAQGVGSSRNAPGTSGGIHKIQGVVYLPSGKPSETQFRVTIEATNTGILNTVTDSNGKFIFSGLEAGDYRVTVEGGKEFQNEYETASIYREVSAGGRTIQLSIQMKYKPQFNPALAGTPPDAMDLYTKGIESVKKGDSKKAVEQLSGAVALYPNFGVALNELGVQYLKLNQPDKAAEVLQRAVRLSPADFSPHLYYGIALLNKKDFAGAETQLREAIKINNNLPTAHMYLGIALLTLSRDEQTKQYDMAKYGEAQKELEAAAASNRAEVAMAHKYLGGIYMGNKEYKRAADELEIYLKLSPKAPDADKLKVIIKDLRSK
jgi:tetratricopeptide (TPR) repeat protein